MGKMERDLQWWKGELAADIHQSLRIKVSVLLAAAFYFFLNFFKEIRGVDI